MANKILLEDYIDVSNTIKKLNIINKTFLITGATGTLATFLINSLNNSKNKIIAVSRDKIKATKKFKDIKNILFKKYDDEIKESVDYIIHFASPTESKFFVEHPYETINAIYSLTNKFLLLAKQKKARFVYISSMEVYGEIKDRKERKEDELGYLDIASPRSSYPLGKRMAEALCHYAYKENNIDVVIARLAQTFGAGSIIDDTRLYAYAAKCKLNNKDIVLSTDGKSYGNYIYLSDAINAILYILIKGKKNETYNVVSKDANIKIIDFCKKIADKKVKVICNVGKNYYPNNTYLKMSNNKLYKLGWRENYTISEMINRYIKYLENAKD